MAEAGQGPMNHQSCRLTAHLAWIVLVAFLIAGCARRAGTQQMAVKGRLEDADGKPLPQVLVRLHNQGQDSISTVSCLTTDAGTFECSCPPGTYKVTVLPVSTKAPETADRVPAAYRSLADTPLQIDIPAGGKTDIVLSLRREKP